MPLYLLTAVLTLLLSGTQALDRTQSQAIPDTGTAAHRDSILSPPLFHNPPVAILNDRPFRMDLFVSIEPGDIQSVSLFMRVDSTKNFREIPLKGEYSRYRYIVPKEELKGPALTYYFLVALRDYRLYAYPVDEDSVLVPFVIDLVSPTKEFFQRELYD